MEAQPHHKPEERATFTVLITGANSGLGFAVCCRLIDEFLSTRPQSQTLHLLFSTRDVAKSEDTLKRLHAHLQKTLRRANGTTLGISLLLEARIKLEGVLVDLLKLASVKALAEQLLRRGQPIDAVVWNAGIPGWSGLNWLQAIWHTSTDLVHATTYPTFPICIVGLEAKSQQGSLAGATVDQTTPEPKLGQVFTANIFGHYLLTHWLCPAMHADSRIIWISSISAVPDTFKVTDVQGLQATMAYEASKRLTDLLVLTSELPSTKPFVHDFLPASPDGARPKMYLTHPGVIGTSIAGLHWIMAAMMAATFYIARWLGSPWHLVDPYKGAVSAAFAVLAPPAQLADLEARDGKGKWGSAIDVFGAERVARTEVEGWGYSGRVGAVPPGSVTGATCRYRYRKETTQASRDQFDEAGWQMWRELERMRIEWEGRLGPVDQKASLDV